MEDREIHVCGVSAAAPSDSQERMPFSWKRQGTLCPRGAVFLNNKGEAREAVVGGVLTATQRGHWAPYPALGTHSHSLGAVLGG